RRRGRSVPGGGAPGGAARPSFDAAPAHLPLLRLDAAGRRRARHVRLSRCPELAPAHGTARGLDALLRAGRLRYGLLAVRAAHGAPASAQVLKARTNSSWEIGTGLR